MLLRVTFNFLTFIRQVSLVVAHSDWRCERDAKRNDEVCWQPFESYTASIECNGSLLCDAKMQQIFVQEIIMREKIFNVSSFIALTQN